MCIRDSAYDAPHLVAILRALGIRQGDTLMVHSSWQPLNGFRGKPADLIAALKEVVGPGGLPVSYTHLDVYKRQL